MSYAAEIAGRLAQNAEAVCRYYLSNGRREGRYWIAGDVANTPGRSLYVRLFGPLSGKGAAGKFTDAATGEHGDLLDLIALSCGYDRLADVRSTARRRRSSATTRCSPSCRSASSSSQAPAFRPMSPGRQSSSASRSGSSTAALKRRRTSATSRITRCGSLRPHRDHVYFRRSGRLGGLFRDARFRAMAAGYALSGAFMVGGAAATRPDPFAEGDGISAYWCRPEGSSSVSFRRK
jgi:hypothetical protein